MSDTTPAPDTRKSEGAQSETLTQKKETHTEVPKPDAISTPPVSAGDVIVVIGVIVLAGVLGGIVNTALGRKEDELVKDPAEKNIIIGIGAAFLVPLFLKSVDSKILDTLNTAPLNGLLLFSYCTLAAISARHFITTLTDQVFKKIDTLKKETEANKQELDKTKLDVEKATKASQSAKNVALAATDAARLQTFDLLKAASPSAKPAALKLTADEYQAALNEEDPWKGKFGKASEQNSRKLDAKLDPIEGQPGLAVITMCVASTDSAKPLTGAVQFFLHPTYKNYMPEISVENGKATLRLISYGAFTVGALCDGGATTLELDLSQIPGAWEPWKSR